MNNLRNSGNNSRAAVNGATSTHSATKIEDTQWVKYRHKTGHGFAAEDVNAQIDCWHGRNVECVGKNNAPSRQNCQQSADTN